MGPRLFEEAEQLLPKPAQAAVIAETAATLQAARAAVASARRDLAWNVHPTDTTDVVKRMIKFTENLRKFLAGVPGFENPSSDFKPHTLIAQASTTIDLLQRHLRLVQHHDDSREQRLTRTTTQVDEELATLSKQGAAAKNDLMDLLEAAEASLFNLS